MARDFHQKHTVALGKLIKLKFSHCSFKQWENGIATTAKTLSVKAKCFKQSLEQWKRFPKTFENDEKVEAGVESSPTSFIFPLHIMARFEQCDHTLKRKVYQIDWNFSKESISTTCWPSPASSPSPEDCQSCLPSPGSSSPPSSTPQTPSSPSSNCSNFSGTCTPCNSSKVHETDNHGVDNLFFSQECPWGTCRFPPKISSNISSSSLPETFNTTGFCSNIR